MKTADNARKKPVSNGDMLLADESNCPFTLSVVIGPDINGRDIIEALNFTVNDNGNQIVIQTGSSGTKVGLVADNLAVSAALNIHNLYTMSKKHCCVQRIVLHCKYLRCFHHHQCSPSSPTSHELKSLPLIDRISLFVGGIYSSAGLYC